MLHEIVEAATRQDASRAIDCFVAEFEPKWPKAAVKLTKDREGLLAFYDFPAEHWRHLRSTNPIESSFATVKLRTRVTKGAGSKDAALAMAYKLLDARPLDRHLGLRLSFGRDQLIRNAGDEALAFALLVSNDRHV